MKNNKENLQRIVLIKERILAEIADCFREKINERLMKDKNDCLKLLNSLQEEVLDLRIETESFFFDNSISYLEYEITNKRYLLILRDIYLLRFEDNEE